MSRADASSATTATAAPTGHRPGAQLTVAALGTLLTLVAFTAPIATLNSTAAALGAGTVGPHLDPQLDEHRARRGAAVHRHDLRRLRPAPHVRGRDGRARGRLRARRPRPRDVWCSWRRGCSRASAGRRWSPPASGSSRRPTRPVRPARRPAACGGPASAPASPSGRCWRPRWTWSRRWRDAYGVIAVAGAAVTVAALRLVHESRSAQPRPLDLPGLLLLAGGMSALLAALVEGRQGWTAPLVLVLAAAACCCSVRSWPSSGAAPPRCSTSRCSGTRRSWPRRSPPWPPAPG